AALRRLLIDEGLLQWARLVFRAEPFDRRDRPVLHRDDRQQAGVDWFAGDNDGAGTALAEAATELRTVEGELAAQRVKQRRRRVDAARRHHRRAAGMAEGAGAGENRRAKLLAGAGRR